MAQKTLNGSDIVASLQKMSCKTVPKRMCADSFVYFGLASRLPDRFIDDAGIDMMAANEAA